MSPRHIRIMRLSRAFMPGLYAFAWPVEGRSYKASRRIALRLWAEAFSLRIRLFDV